MSNAQAKEELAKVFGRMTTEEMQEKIEERKKAKDVESLTKNSD